MKKLTKGQIIALSGSLAGIAYILKQFIGYEPVTITLMLLATLIAGIPIFKKAIGALRYKIVGIDALVTIAVIGALLIGEYWEAAAVTFLFMLGDYLESKTIDKTRSSIKALLDLAPDKARIRRNGTEIEVSAKEVAAGDLVVIRPGEKIPADGTVKEGSAYVNQAAITGESIPIARAAGETVFSGTVLESGFLVVRADLVGEDTTFARIMEMVEDAQDKKAKTQKFLEKFSRWYTPAIILLAIAMYLYTRDIYLSLTLLVIACPGALVISTPVSIAAGIGNGALHGVLMKGGDIIEKLGTVKVVAFDKTGTLTKGKPAVTKLKAFGMTEAQLLEIAAVGETYSEHPLARAILKRADEEIGSVGKPEDEPKILTGQGISFRHAGEDYLIGNRRLFRENGISLGAVEEEIEAEEDKGQTVVILGSVRGVHGIIAIADTLRPDARELVGRLKKLGIEQVVMLTGDNERAARAIAEKAGLDAHYSELMPEDKVKVLTQLQEKYGRVAMIGDGVNDAPALASADLGVAVGGVGSDVAMETADVVLMSAEIGKLSYAVGLSRATVHNMKQNIAFALLVAGTLLAGVLIKSVNLSFGMLVHEISVLLVIINAARLLKFGNKKDEIRREEAANEQYSAS